MIKVNKIKCNHCYVTIESKHRHDMVRCECGKVAVDGGHDYLRRCGLGWIELSEVVNEVL